MDKNFRTVLVISSFRKTIPSYYLHHSGRDPKSVTDIEIPDSVTKIGEYAFQFCSRLTCILIPSSVTEIEPGAFSHCSGVTRIVVSKSNPAYASVNNCCLSKNLKELVFGCKTSILPDGITEIKQSAFAGCSDLTHFEIPDSVTKIGNGAFRGTGLKEIVIPETVIEIGIGVFSDCKELTTVIFRGQRSRIESNMFSGCMSLMHVTLPRNLAEIGSFAFYDARLEFNILDGVKKNRERSFRKLFWRLA